MSARTTEGTPSRTSLSSQPSGPKLRQRRWAIIASGGAHSLHDGYTDSLYVLLPLWAETFGLSYAQIGLLKTLFSGAMAGFQIPAGILAEWIGERRLLALGTAMLGVGYAGFGATGGLAGLVFCLLFAGLGSSVQHPLASSVIARAFGSGGHRAALGVYNFMGDLGKVVFPAAMAMAIAFMGWEYGSFAFGCFAIAAGIAIFFVLQRLDLGNRPTGPVAPAKEQGPGSAPGWGIRQQRGFALLSSIGIIDSIARAGFLTFLPFLLTARGADVKMIGFALALTFAGGAGGKLLCGLMAQRFGIIRSVVVTEFVTGAMIIILVALPVVWIMPLLPLLGVALNGTSSVLYGTVSDFADPDRQSRTFGLFYTMVVGASAAAPVAYGLLSDIIGLEGALRACGAIAFLTLPLCTMLQPALAALRIDENA